VKTRKVGKLLVVTLPRNLVENERIEEGEIVNVTIRESGRMTSVFSRASVPSLLMMS
jgi:antitoxin component of MazEF toxin-antitoxin module